MSGQRKEIPDGVWLPIALAIAKEHRIPVGTIMSHQRTIWTVVPRTKFWQTLHNLNYSLNAIGGITGHHHTTVHAALNDPGRISRTYADGRLNMRTRAHRKSPAIAAGSVFGELTVTRKAEIAGTKAVHYWCVCSCGVVLKVAKCALNRGNKTNCGKQHGANLGEASSLPMGACQ